VISSYYLGAVLGNLHRFLQRYSKINEPLANKLVGIWVEPRVITHTRPFVGANMCFFYFDSAIVFISKT